MRLTIRFATKVLVLASTLAGLATPALAQGGDAADNVTVELRGATGSLTSAVVARRAVDTAPSIQAAQTAVAAVQSNVREVRAAIAPSLQLSARYTRLSPVNNDPLITGLGSEGASALVGGVDDPEARALWAGTLAQQQALATQRIPVFLNQVSVDAVVQVPVSQIFLTLLPRLQAARIAVDAERARTEVVEQRVRLQAREAFYEYVRGRALLAVSVQRVRDLREQARIASASFEAGQLRRSELLGASAQLAQAEAGLVGAEAAVEASAETLRALMHMPPETPLVPGEDLTAELAQQDLGLAALTRLAFERRPETRALRCGIRAEQHGRAAARGARYPTVGVSFGAQVSNPNPRFVPQRDRFDATWDFSVVMSWSPNQTVAANAQATAAAARAAALAADLAAFADALRSEVAGAWSADRAALARIVAAEAGVAAADEAFRTRQAERAAGEATLFEVLQAETALAQARFGWVDAAVNARIARSRIAYATSDAVPAPGLAP